MIEKKKVAGIKYKVFSDLWFDWENKSSICILEIFIFF